MTASIVKPHTFNHTCEQLGGWADLTMVLGYAHLSSEHLSEFAENAKVGTNRLHDEKKPRSVKRYEV